MNQNHWCPARSAAIHPRYGGSSLEVSSPYRNALWLDDKRFDYHNSITLISRSTLLADWLAHVT